MKILIVSFFDDNFGDNLIRICFKNILKTVLSNLNYHKDEFEISAMPLKEIDSTKVNEADYIFFAGGGLFGSSYLGFYDYVNEILEIADNKNIPVVFSSMGLNDMSADEQSAENLRNLLNRSCIKAVSVRENIDFFKEFSKDAKYIVEQVCDPVVWCKYVFANETIEKNSCIGINVVRGELFKANKKKWLLEDELEYLKGIKELLEKANIDYRFYTNGSILDNIMLKYFADTCQIQKEKLLDINTSRELVKAIASFDGVLAIRMHSSIIAYGMSVPAVNLVWNDKIPHFYSAIGSENRAIDIQKWTAESAWEQLKTAMQEGVKIDENYLMTLYNYLYNAVKKVIGEKEGAVLAYGFDEVTSKLGQMGIDGSEDDLDLRIKLKKAERYYMMYYMESRAQKAELKELKGIFSVRAKRWLDRHSKK